MEQGWSSLFTESTEPSLQEMEAYIHSDLWREINSFLSETYSIAPQLAYSRCSGQPGWNVKYQKGGKSLCTLYPMDGSFIALVVIGAKETPEAELLVPLCSDYTRELYRGVPFSCGGKWLMIQVTSRQILQDTQKLIALRVKPKIK